MTWHVIPAGRLCSLRRALMLWLLPFFLLAGATAAGCAYWGYSRTVGTFMDHQMVVLADSIAAGNASPALQPQTRENIYHWGIYAVQLWDGNGAAPSASSWDGSGVPRLDGDGFDDVRTPAGRWRVYASRGVPGAGTDRPVRQVQVIQNLDFRRQVVVGRAGESVLPILLLLPITAFVLWRVIAAVTRSLGQVAEEAAAQDLRSASAIPLDRVPREIQPLVVGFNGMLARLRDALAAQHRFVQDAAHELRTPIAAIGLQLECMRSDVNCSEAGRRFDQLEAGVQRAQRLVDQLMKLSRQENAGARDAASMVDVHAMLRDSVGAFIALADQRRIDLGLEGEAPALPVTLDCPAGELRSVIDNLLDNALRYTPEGGKVDVRVRARGAAGGLVLEVADTGPGIPDALLARVFDRFYRVPGGDARGSGLGLAIAQAAAGRCGLQIQLANRSDGPGLIARVALAGTAVAGPAAPANVPSLPAGTIHRAEPA